MNNESLNKLEKYLEKRIAMRTIGGVWLSRKYADRILEIIQQIPRTK